MSKIYGATPVKTAADLKRLAKMRKSVSAFFGHDVRKANIWWTTDNPMLGGVSPISMLKSGKADRLERFIDESLSKNGDNNDR